MRSQFITPTVSVFDANGRPDPEQNLRVYDHIARGGVSGMVILGSTGEFFSMSMETAKRFIDIATSWKRPAGFRLFAGTSRMDPDETVTLANYATDRGVDGVMIISPYYFPLNDDCVCDFYSRVAPRISCPIFIYNFPDRTGYSVSSAATLKLVTKFRNITGFKDTISGVNHTCELIRTIKPEFPEFEIFSGFDNNFAHNVLSGGSGCIGGLSNVIPEVFARWIDAFARDDLHKVAELQRYIDKMMDFYAVGDPFIPMIKKGLVLRGVIDSDVCTPPFLCASDGQAARIRDLLETMGIAKVG
ncbi:MAG: dihydrodipicolinate synthase family protein [Chthoniobacter sp.]|nr:dihydrodipicolinate synthase family protein [Chthoniobacter sp.]